VRGATLLEAMISLLVMSVGLLGMAALQLTAMRENAGALRHSQATWLAYDMADRMRANLDHNPSTAAGDRANHYDGVAVPVAASGDEEAGEPSCGVGDNCDFAAMATFDEMKWGEGVAQLPGGAGTVTKIDAVGRYRVRVMWDEGDNPGCPTDPVDARTEKTCVEITVQP
jgi:type IV pilus assembly protein PilV